MSVCLWNVFPFIYFPSFFFSYLPLQTSLILWNANLISNQRIVFNIILIKAKENKNFSNFKKLRIKKSQAENEEKNQRKRACMCLSKRQREGTRGKKAGAKLHKFYRLQIYSNMPLWIGASLLNTYVVYALHHGNFPAKR